MKEITYSQIGQDLFVKRLLQEKTNGLFLDIGAAWPTNINNTYLFEKHYNWTGLSIEFDEQYERLWMQSDRTSKFICNDALKVDYITELGKLLADNGADRIDYLSVDIEPPILTLKALLNIPFDKFKFSVITFEHDSYRDDNGHTFDKQYTMRESREFLTHHGYKLVFANMQEDWWIDPTIFTNFDSFIDINTVPQNILYA